MTFDHSSALCSGQGFRFLPNLVTYLCRVVSSNYYGLPKLPILHCCLYLRCFQSSVLLQDIYVSEGWSTWLFSSMLQDPVDKSWYWLILISKAMACKAPSSLSYLMWAYWMITIKFFVGHMPLPMNVVHCRTGELIPPWQQKSDVSVALIRWISRSLLICCMLSKWPLYASWCLSLC